MNPGTIPARTLAWLGDVEFERAVRIRLVGRGDFRNDRLDAMKSRLVCAEAQARLLERLLDRLDDDEHALVRRAKNAAVPRSPRGRAPTARYRLATAFEALIGAWSLSEPGRIRCETLLSPLLDAEVDAIVAAERHSQGTAGTSSAPGSARHTRASPSKS